MGTDDSSLLNGIIDYDYAAKIAAECRNQLKQYEHFESSIDLGALISETMDPNSVPDTYTISIPARQCGRNGPIFYYVNPEIYKLMYPLPDVLQKEVDKFIQETWIQTRRTFDTAPKKQLDKNKKSTKSQSEIIQNAIKNGIIKWR